MKIPDFPSAAAGRRAAARVLAGLTGTAVALGSLGSAHAARPAVNPTHPSVVKDNPADWTPNVLDGSVEAIAQIGDRVYLGGSFTRVQKPRRGATVKVPYLVAVNARTGAVDEDFDAAVDGTVRAIEPAADGRSLYLGGDFREAGGVQRRSLARVDAGTGDAVKGFTAPALDSVVHDLRLVGSRLFLGGAFGTVAGRARPALAAVAPGTGAVDNTVDLGFAKQRVSQTGARAPIRVSALDATPDGKRLVVIGAFGEVDGQSRGQLAVLDVGKDVTLSRWATTRYAPYCATSIPSTVRGLDISPDGKYFVVATSGGPVSNTLCDTAARWDLGSDGPNKQPAWVNHTGGDTLLSVAITGAAVYVGGHQRWLDNPRGSNRPGPGAVTREGIGAINPSTGKALSWNPGKERGIGTGALYATKAGLWIGSDTELVAGERRERVAFFPL
ncbi:hypothetical protein GCM10010123_11360 [Pilimelia anulata]|uniref:Uncharacterized protein n=1 Tax=Pilimelia anulata TaxID=53371 RepID=A0A8J3B1N1_9ACTN|nr:hypothetical protein [Pilimelia anulata]GGJ83460.1 hypothetical protein GCM10010123_11360 [Pilimelia anulata]